MKKSETYLPPPDLVSGDFCARTQHLWWWDVPQACRGDDRISCKGSLLVIITAL